MEHLIYPEYSGNANIKSAIIQPLTGLLPSVEELQKPERMTNDRNSRSGGTGYQKHFNRFEFQFKSE